MNHILIMFTVILAGVVFPVSVFADEDSIPVWIKDILNFYVKGEITDTELISALEFMILNDIINIPQQDSDRIKELESENEILTTQVRTLEIMIDVVNVSPEWINNNLQTITGKVIVCETDKYGYLNVKGQITNNDSISHSPQMIIYASDINGNMLTFVEHIEMNVRAGQTVYFDRSLDDSSSIDNCGVKIEQFN